MAKPLPSTPLSLLSRLRDEKNSPLWEISWRRFLELYWEPLMATAAGIYRSHTGNAIPPQPFLEDIVAQVVLEFLKADRFDPQRGRLRTYLRMLTNARIVDALRKEKPFQSIALDDGAAVPAETDEEKESFEKSLLNTLLEDLREQVPPQHFETFEMVKLHQIPPERVARDLGVHRNVVDNTIYRVMKKLREIASKPEYQDEYYA